MLPFSWKLLPCISHASLSLKGSTLHLPSLLFPGRCSLHWPCLPFSFQISTACVLWILKKHICVHLIGTLQFPCFQSLSFILWTTYTLKAGELKSRINTLGSPGINLFMYLFICAFLIYFLWKLYTRAGTFKCSCQQQNWGDKQKKCQPAALGDSKIGKKHPPCPTSVKVLGHLLKWRVQVEMGFWWKVVVFSIKGLTLLCVTSIPLLSVVGLHSLGNLQT